MPELYILRHKYFIWRLTNTAALFISSFGTFYFFMSASAPSWETNQGLPMPRDAKPRLLGSSSPPPPTLSSPILNLCKWIHNMYILVYDHDCSSHLNWTLSTVNKPTFLHKSVTYSQSLCKRPNLTNCVAFSAHFCSDWLNKFNEHFFLAFTTVLCSSCIIFSEKFCAETCRAQMERETNDLLPVQQLLVVFISFLQFISTIRLFPLDQYAFH